MGRWDPAKPNAGRSGARWRACRAAVLERDENVCHWCNHPGAGEVDHWPRSIAELRAAGLDPDDPDHSVAAHGVNAPCTTCGCTANQQRNASDYQPSATPTRCAYAAEAEHYSECTLTHSQRW